MHKSLYLLGNLAYNGCNALKEGHMDFKELSPGVYAALVPDGTANAGFITGDGEVLVVDRETVSGNAAVL